MIARFNGVELPMLPQWDTYGFPYAFIGSGAEEGVYMLTFLSVRPVYGTDPNGSGSTGVYCTAPRSLSYYPSGGKWVYYRSSDNDLHVDDGEGQILWTNTDILRESDGSVWLAASKPILIPEGTEAWKERFLRGLLLGMRTAPADPVERKPMGYDYGGYRLPTIPDPATVLKDGKPCKYALLYPVDVIDGRKRFYVLYNDVPFQPVGLPEYHADYYYGGYYQFNFGPIGLYPRRRITEGERDWYEWPKETDLSITFTTHHILWISHDISYTLNGKEQVILWHEEPVPIFNDPWFWEVTEE